MPDDEYIKLDRYRGFLYNELANISGSFPVLITDYINCNRLKALEEEKKQMDYFLSEQVDLKILKASQFLVSLSGDDLVTLNETDKLSYF